MVKSGIYVIDRVEDNFAVLVPDGGGDAVSVPTSVLGCASEGTAVEISGEENPVFRILPAGERPSEKEKNSERLRSLFKKSKER